MSIRIPITVIFGLLLSLVAIGHIYAQGEHVIDASLGQVGIRVAPTHYTPEMSSTVGVGLTPISPFGRAHSTLGSVWSTDFGEFVRWAEPDFLVEPLGSTAEVPFGETVYWRFDAALRTDEPFPVNICLEVVDAIDRTPISSRCISLEWDGDAVALASE